MLSRAEMTPSFSTHIHLASWLAKYDGGELKKFFVGFDKYDPDCDLREHHPDDIVWKFGPLLVYFAFPLNDPLLLNITTLHPASLGNFVSMVARVYDKLYRDNDRRIWGHHTFDDLFLEGFCRHLNSIWDLDIRPRLRG
jgi:hypothetical protein